MASAAAGTLTVVATACLLGGLSLAPAASHVVGSPAEQAPVLHSGQRAPLRSGGQRAPLRSGGQWAVAPASTSPSPARPGALSARHGPPYPVTEVTVPIVDKSRPTVANGREISPRRALTTEVWGPDAPGRYPLVVFAAGFRVGPKPYEALLTSWARHGFVVAAPEFPLTDAAVAGANLDEADIANQPADLRYVTDTLVAPASPVAAHVDPNLVAVAGHSDGAETALDASALPTPPGQPRYRALICMSGQPLRLVRPPRNPPLLVIQGDADTVDPPALGYRVWEEAVRPKFLLVLHGAGHLPVEAGSAWLPVTVAVTNAFLDTYLADDAGAAGITAAGNDPPLATVRSSASASAQGRAAH
ncbi:MAG: alpha/beta hydrolase family protein [Acidimicrobiales bacterium]